MRHIHPRLPNADDLRPNADLLTSAMSGDPQGVNPIFAEYRKAGIFAARVLDNGALIEPIKVQPNHVIRFYERGTP